MSKAFDFCIPHTPDWIHEIKYDGYRLRLERNGDLAPAGRDPKSSVPESHSYIVSGADLLPDLPHPD
jgi:hypothetical protein